MSNTLPLRGRNRTGAAGVSSRVDLIVAIVAFITFIAIVAIFQYRHVMAEDDLYRVMIGLLDGVDSGRYLDSPMHYIPDFGFGYLAAMFHFAPMDVLRDPDRLMPLMNQVGLWSLVPGLPCLWFAIRMVHGATVATIALIVFAFSPLMLELATSGHQVLPMFAFLAAAAICMFLPVRGWSAVLAGVAAALLLFCGFLSRAEIFLAFPWLVLSRIDTRSLRAFVVSGIVRSLPPVAAMILFTALRQALFRTQMGGAVDHYFGSFYSWATMVPGAVYMAVGCGLATAAIGLLCAAGLVVIDRRRLGELLGPLALVLVPLCFFLPNPQPTRHFMMTLIGFGILIGIALVRRTALNRAVAYAAVLLLVLANHVLAEAVRPILLRQNDAHSPLIRVPESYRTTTHANIGWFWQRHAALADRRGELQALGNRLLTSCDPYTLMLSDAGPVVFSRIYAGGGQVAAEPFELGRFNEGRLGVRDGRNFLVLTKQPGWPADAVAAILADPALDRYKIAEDPWSMSRYDKTPVPAGRAARFGCAPPR